MTSTKTEFSLEEIESGIASALREDRNDIAVSLLKMLAVRAPDRAQIVLDAIRLLADVDETRAVLTAGYVDELDELDPRDVPPYLRTHAESPYVRLDRQENTR
ncbi:MAG TPA: hypothetical protein VKA83_22245 [Methylomirabilota bacterium]|nr:hypothetical protein [Methylomirabilota bacterium]